MNAKAPFLLISFLILIISYTLSQKIVSSDFRMLFVILSFLILFISSFNYKRGMYAILIYLIIMPFLRRISAFYGGSMVSDPLLILSDIIFFWILLGYWLFNESYIMKFVKEDKLTKVYIIFILLCLLSVFNPLQGSLIIGLTGAKLFILPSMWFFLGLSLSINDYRNLLKFIVGMGALTGIYSIYQYVGGFTEFEWKWIHDAKLQLYLKEEIRPFSVFAGNSDAARFFQIAAGISFMYIISIINIVPNLIMFSLSFTAMLLTVSRSAAMAFIFMLGIFFLWGSKDIRRVTLHSIVLLLFVLTVYVLIPEKYKNASDISERTFSTHLTAGLLNPIGEGSVQVRFRTWGEIPNHLLKAPFGYGIGSITLAAQRYGGFLFYSESSYFGIWGATGIIGGCLFTYLLYLVFKYLIELYVKSNNNDEFLRIVIGFVAGVTASIIIAELFNFYAVAPFFWITVGWVVRAHSELKNAIHNNTEL